MKYLPESRYKLTGNPHGDTALEPSSVVIANAAPGFGSTFRGFFAPPNPRKTRCRKALTPSKPEQKNV